MPPNKKRLTPGLDDKTFFSFDAGEFFYIAVPKKNEKKEKKEKKDDDELEKEEISISGINRRFSIRPRMVLGLVGPSKQTKAY